jgi:hypothetical protein
MYSHPILPPPDDRIAPHGRKFDICKRDNYSPMRDSVSTVKQIEKALSEAVITGAREVLKTRREGA